VVRRLAAALVVIGAAAGAFLTSGLLQQDDPSKAPPTLTVTRLTSDDGTQFDLRSRFTTRGVLRLEVVSSTTAPLRAAAWKLGGDTLSVRSSARDGRPDSFEVQLTQRVTARGRDSTGGAFYWPNTVVVRLRVPDGASVAITDWCFRPLAGEETCGSEATRRDWLVRLLSALALLGVLAALPEKKKFGEQSETDHEAPGVALPAMTHRVVIAAIIDEVVANPARAWDDAARRLARDLLRSRILDEVPDNAPLPPSFAKARTSERLLVTGAYGALLSEFQARVADVSVKLANVPVARLPAPRVPGGT
jgi:hypothetical protein